MNISFVRIKVHIKLYTGSYFILFLSCCWAQGIVIILIFIVWSFNPIVVADRWYYFRFRCPFLHLFVLSVFDTFLKVKSSNKKYPIKQVSIRLH